MDYTIVDTNELVHVQTSYYQLESRSLFAKEVLQAG